MNGRLQSLDALRGLTVALMILVNTSGDGAHTFHILQHSAWNGCTLADTVFPCFLFMVGVSAVFALASRLARGASRAAILREALQRAAILFALGLLINTFPTFHLETLRVFGVLQRIALCYLALVLILVAGAKARTLTALFFFILIGYWALLRFVPTPGVGLAFLDPHNNLPAWLDRHLLPAAHLYRRGFYDPEGLLTTLPALGSTLLGALTAFWLRSAHTLADKARGLFATGIACCVTGLLWSGTFPFNKRLWTSSFVLWTGGLALLALALLFFALDVRRSRPRWLTPAFAFGTNALSAYILSELLAALLGTLRWPANGPTLQRHLFVPLAALIPNPYLASLTYAVLFTLACLLPILLLFRKGIVFKV